MRQKIIILFLIVGLGLMAASATAQMNQQKNKFLVEFQRTEQVIDQARNIITASGTERGVEVLKIAIKLQDESRNYGMSQNFEIGHRLTMSAREKAKSAIYLNRRAEENENLVLRQLEKTDNLIQRVDSHANENLPQNALNLFDTARENQRRAWEFYRKSELRPALKLSKQAEKMIRNLVERVSESQGTSNRVRNQLHILENNYEQIRTRISECGSDQAMKLFEKAEESYRKAKSFSNEGKLKQAEKHLNQTRRQLSRAAEFCPNNDNIEGRISRLKIELNRVKEVAIEAGSSRASELILSAQGYLLKAEQFCDQDKGSEKCVANLRAAELAVEKARNILELH